jgi:hypothetical protein
MKWARPAPLVIGWKINRIKYRAIPFYADGKPGVANPPSAFI